MTKSVRPACRSRMPAPIPPNPAPMMATRACPGREWALAGIAAPGSLAGAVARVPGAVPVSGVAGVSGAVPVSGVVGVSGAVTVTSRAPRPGR
jgi:hypothetical protein